MKTHLLYEKKEEESRNEALPICNLNRFRLNEREVQEDLKTKSSECGRSDFARLIDPCVNPYPTAFPYGNGMVLHLYQQQESSTTKTVHKVISKGLKAYV